MTASTTSAWTCEPLARAVVICTVSSRPVAPGCRSTSTRCRRASPTRTARVRAPTPAPPAPACSRWQCEIGGTGDIGKQLAEQHGVPIYSSINLALCCGGSELAVDGVIMIGEHGDYPSALDPRPHPTSHLTGHASGGTRKGSTSSRGSTSWSRSSASLPPAADPCPSSTTNTCTCHLSPNCRSMPACKSWLSLAVRDGRRGVPQLVQLARRAVDGREGEGARRTLHGRILSRQLL